MEYRGLAEGLAERAERRRKAQEDVVPVEDVGIEEQMVALSFGFKA